MLINLVSAYSCLTESLHLIFFCYNLNQTYSQKMKILQCLFGALLVTKMNSIQIVLWALEPLLS